MQKESEPATDYEIARFPKNDKSGGQEEIAMTFNRHYSVMYNMRKVSKAQCRLFTLLYAIKFMLFYRTVEQGILLQNHSGKYTRY